MYTWLEQRLALTPNIAMSSIASPRPSIALSSRRTSTSTDCSASATRQSTAPATGHQRRNRAALRDYYGLKAGATDEGKNAAPAPTLDPETESELDKEGFEPEQYVMDILAREGLEGVMRVEAGLVSEIRTLDGEKKALVYDNYSKLIAATDTIRKMRTNMDPLTPTTATLTPAIGHIAETATALSDSLKKQHLPSIAQEYSEAQKKKKQQETVRWVLDAPGRLRKLVDDGQRQDAETQWAQISGLLDKWSAVSGVQGVRENCQKIMEGADR